MPEPLVKPYGRDLLLRMLPFWLLSVVCLVIGLVNGWTFTWLCGALAVVAFPIQLWRHWSPPPDA
jgi:hypothetical protein